MVNKNKPTCINTPASSACACIMIRTSLSIIHNIPYPVLFMSLIFPSDI